MSRVMIALLAIALPTVAFAQNDLARKADPTAVVFHPTTPLATFKISLDDTNLKLLKQNPRQYVHAKVVVGNVTFDDVALHLKGAAGSFRNWDDRPALTINLDKFVPGQNYQGLNKFHLNNSVQDNSYMNEIVCSNLSRIMGLTTARATHAVVELNGRKVGLYVMKEGYNRAFLKRNFPKASHGNLYDGGFLQDIDQNLKLDTGTDTQWKELKALSEACKIGDPKKRYEAVEKLVNVELFVKNAALQIIGTDWDGYMRNRNNYRLYFHPLDNKAIFIPHGMDQMFENPNDSLWHGWGGMVARAILDYPEGKKKAISAMIDLTDKHLTPEFVQGLDQYIVRTRDGLAATNKDWAKSFETAARDKQNRVKLRMEFARKELPKLK